MIVTVTDFGSEGPYLAQMKASILHKAPHLQILDLFSDAPAFDPHATAYLLAAHISAFPAGTVVLGVVDPGVGTNRRPVVVHAGDRWFVGPDNGLFAVALRHAGGGAAWTIDWRPERLSSSFHGRDLFAPVAAGLACNPVPPGRPIDPARLVGADWPEDLDEVIYIDHYGNAMTGRRSTNVPASADVGVGGRRLPHAGTFADVAPGEAIWYANSNGLLELAVNRGRADTALGIGPGTPVRIDPGGPRVEPGRNTP